MKTQQQVIRSLSGIICGLIGSVVVLFAWIIGLTIQYSSDISAIRKENKQVIEIVQTQTNNIHGLMVNQETMNKTDQNMMESIKSQQNLLLSHQRMLMLRY